MGKSSRHEGREGGSSMKKAIVLFVLVLGMVGAASASAEENGPPASGAGTYVVGPRDSVEKVARQFGVTVEEIISANPRAVMPRNVCEGTKERTLRSGTVITTCRRTENWFRRVGLTITIPVSRAALESETARLNAEIRTLRAERDEARKERDVLLALRDAREKTNVELDEKANEPENHRDRSEQSASAPPSPAIAAASCPTNPKGAPTEAGGNSNAGYLFVATLLLAAIVVLYQHFQPSKRAKRFAAQAQTEITRIVRERADLEVARENAIREATEAFKAKRWLEAGRKVFETQKREFETRVTEVTRSLVEREANLKRRESVPPIYRPCGPDVKDIQAKLLFLNLTIVRGRQLLAEEKRKLEEREERCAKREEILRALGVTLANQGRATSDDEEGDTVDDNTTPLPPPDQTADGDTTDGETTCAICQVVFPSRANFEAHKVANLACKNAFPHTLTLRPPKDPAV